MVLTQTIMDIVLNWPNHWATSLNKATIDKIIHNIYAASLEATVQFLKEEWKKCQIKYVGLTDFADAIFEGTHIDEDGTDVSTNHASHRLHLSLENVNGILKRHFEISTMSDNVANKLALDMQQNGKKNLAQKIEDVWGKVVGKEDAGVYKDSYSNVLMLANDRSQDNLVSALLEQVNGHFIRAVQRLYTENSKKQEQIAAIMLTAPNLDVDIADTDGETALFVTALNNDAKFATALLARGALVNNATTYGATPLYVACEKGFADIVEILLHAPNIDVNVGSMRYGWTPLTVACEKGKLQIVHFLLAMGDIDVNKPLTNGDTPLHVAASNNKIGAMDALIQMKGIDVNATANDDGSTALHILCYRACHVNINNDEVKFARIYACIERLLDVENIECDLLDHDEITPFSFTEFTKWKDNPSAQRHQQIVQLLLLNAGAKVPKTFRGVRPRYGSARSKYDKQRLENSKQTTLANQVLVTMPYLIAPMALRLVLGNIGQYCSVCTRLIRGRCRGDAEVQCIACYDKSRYDNSRATIGAVRQAGLFTQWVCRPTVYKRPRHLLKWKPN